tara:strand:+ start:927 stop:2258 length:1332 start_codon:yes stop_codon:yes gene_type:complete
VYNPLEELHPYEKWAINGLTLVFVLVFAGLGLEILEISNPLSEALFEYFVDPIRGESTGDSGYNNYNTMTYAIVLGLFVLAMSAWLRGLGIDPSDASVVALLPFVTWAAFGEVVEDAEMFGPALSPYFVSPGIHFQAAFWVILAGGIALTSQRLRGDDDESAENLEGMAMILVFAQFALYGASISSSHRVGLFDIDMTPMFLSTAMGIVFIRISRDSTSNFTPVQRLVYLVGIGGSMIFLGALASYAFERPPEQEMLWPLVVVIVIPSIVAYQMYQYGREASEELSRHGLVAGILPPGMTDEDYGKLTDSEDKDLIEDLRTRATMAQPLVFLAVAGQLMDGIATWVGIDGFPGLSEKHVVSQKVIDAGLWLNGELGIEHWMLDEGVWLFAIVKAGLAGLIFYLFSTLNFEHRERHLRLLVGVAMLVVGMAPGLRDVGRLVLGV